MDFILIFCLFGVCFPCQKKKCNHQIGELGKEREPKELLLAELDPPKKLKAVSPNITPGSSSCLAAPRPVPELEGERARPSPPPKGVNPLPWSAKNCRRESGRSQWPGFRGAARSAFSLPPGLATEQRGALAPRLGPRSSLAHSGVERRPPNERPGRALPASPALTAPQGVVERTGGLSAPRMARPLPKRAWP